MLVGEDFFGILLESKLYKTCDGLPNFNVFCVLGCEHIYVYRFHSYCLANLDLYILANHTALDKVVVLAIYTSYLIIGCKPKIKQLKRDVNCV